MTNYWEHKSAEKEMTDGKAIINAAKDAGVELLLWSGLESVSRISGGKLDKVHHFDSKVRVLLCCSASSKNDFAELSPFAPPRRLPLPSTPGRAEYLLLLLSLVCLLRSSLPLPCPLPRKPSPSSWFPDSFFYCGSSSLTWL